MMDCPWGGVDKVKGGVGLYGVNATTPSTLERCSKQGQLVPTAPLPSWELLTSSPPAPSTTQYISERPALLSHAISTQPSTVQPTNPDHKTQPNTAQ